MEKNYKVAGLVIAAFIFGGIVTKNIPASNNSNAENNVTINQSVPENFGKIPINSEKIEKNPKKSEKFDINNDDLEYIKNSLPGIGNYNIKKWRKRLDEKGKFTNVYQLLEDGVLGRDSFARHKDKFYAGE